MQSIVKVFGVVSGLMEGSADSESLPMDVDEKTNRVAIGIDRAESQPGLEKVIARLGVAHDAIEIVKVGPILSASELGSWRPSTGGLQDVPRKTRSG